MEVDDEQEVVTKTAPNLAEFGIGGFEFSGDWVKTDFLPQLQWPRAGKVYEEMSSNDPTIGAVLFMAKQLVRRSRWTVLAGTDPREQEAKEFIESCMSDMDQSWNEFIGEVLSMMIYGWSLHEVVYKIRKGRQSNPKYNSTYNDGKIGWRKLASRGQNTCYGWEIDQETGEVLALKQQAAPDYGIRIIPLSKSLHFKTENNYGNPFGRSLLRNTYRPWFFKKRIEEIEGIGIERDLAGLPVLIPPKEVDIWNATDPTMVQHKNNSERLVKSIRRDQSEGVVIPFGWELKLLSTGSRRQFDTNMILNRYDQRIAITLLADIVMLGADKVGSFALADVKKSLLSAALETLLDSIADAINRQEIPRLLELNGYGDLHCLPILKPDEVETPSLSEVAILLKAMGDVGMVINDPAVEEYLRRIASMPQTEEDLLEFKKQQYKKSFEEPEETKPVAVEEPLEDTRVITKGGIDGKLEE